MSNIAIRGLVLVMLMLLAGCSSNSKYAPVSDLSARAHAGDVAGKHVVKTGETLYSIAYRYGRDYKELARQNSIPAPYTIYPGQTLQLNRSTLVSAESGSRVQSTTVRPLASTSTGISGSTSSSKDVEKSSKGSTVGSSKTSPSRAISVAAGDDRPTATSKSGLTWQWPVSGKVVSTFSQNRNSDKGINIAGIAGSPVRAAADGVVVYAGNGLRGYVNLVIINHNQEFLSAYAHNQKILVREQQKVKRGDVIAEMGQSEAKSGMLYFEIRQDGQPVNPLSYLPKR
ncbi:peptidoglycan DD-metalloendopeptidase family protein [Pokkaliibacter sp. MBI-7]|uniref:peptidoglycan DD-metalloendopeptidase family protein n=1 Tax=Pokkaliibacter sp. MBI-7 TaxID=3040600 RepID=UPI002448D399|nr:peptidoglycan DD-metalloendopeptidase family protein [Pokkaliibacter sp. MBI-7]MDH2434580.1 peptidoglycan DD-metalloendopeptidase family protein [Pokkaliibacter sp. MBI-7]